jgi:hypothetical protein
MGEVIQFVNLNLEIFDSMLNIIKQLRGKIELDKKFSDDLQIDLKKEWQKFDILLDKKIKIQREKEALQIEISALKEIIKEKQSEVEEEYKQKNFWMDRCDGLHTKLIELRSKTRKKRTR